MTAAQQLERLHPQIEVAPIASGELLERRIPKARSFGSCPDFPRSKNLPVPALQNYLFKVYTLDTEPGSPGGLSKEELLRAMEGCILDEGELVAIYERAIRSWSIFDLLLVLHCV
jgi:hypothetical protein